MNPLEPIYDNAAAWNADLVEREHQRQRYIQRSYSRRVQIQAAMLIPLVVFIVCWCCVPTCQHVDWGLGVGVVAILSAPGLIGVYCIVCDIKTSLRLVRDSARLLAKSEDHLQTLRQDMKMVQQMLDKNTATTW